MTEFSSAQRRLVVARAQTLEERLGARGAIIDAAPPAQVDARLDRWRRVVSFGQPGLLERRFEWAQINEGAARSLLGCTRLADEKTPDWLEVLDRAIGAARSHRSSPLDTEKVPFGDLLAPFVAAASEGVADLFATRSAFAAQCRSAFEAELLQRLSTIAGRTLLLEFNIFRKRHRGFSGGPNATSSASRLQYSQFVTQLVGRLPEFLCEYAVLARLIGTALCGWSAALRELAFRLDADMPHLKTAFGVSGPVRSVAVNCSDPHNGGRGVHLLDFENGRGLAYKPRDDALNAALGSFFDWLASSGFQTRFRANRVLLRGGYSWCELVVPEECANEDEIRQFANNAGRLACVMYLLQASDLHSENVIALRDQLIPIDTETLVTPRFRYANWDGIADSSDGAAIQLLGCSVLRSGLLPVHRLNSDGSTFDVGGLGSAENRAVTFERLQWKDVNTDAMTVAVETATAVVPGENLPVVGGKGISLGKHIDAICDGFDQTYRFLLGCRDTLFENGSPLHEFCGRASRFVFRDTSTYYGLLERSLSPSLMRDGIDRSIELDVLTRASLLHDDGKNFFDIALAEIRALERMDIPRFLATTDSTSLHLDQKAVLEEAFREEPFQWLLARFNHWGSEDLARQEALLRIALRGPFRGSADAALERGGRRRFNVARDDVQLSFASMAAALANLLRDVALEDRSGNLTWISHTLVGRDARYEVEPADDGLYMGAAGIAIFFAAFAKRGHPAAAEWARGALGPIRARVTAAAFKKALSGAKIGIGTGIGSLVYSFLTVGRLLRDESLIDDAFEIASEISIERVRKDNNLDVLAGAAGALLALVALHDSKPSPSVLNSAVACGEYLLERRKELRGAKVWMTDGELPSSGFAHGTAGIGYSLYRLFTLTGDRKYSEAAREALDWEVAWYGACEESDRRAPAHLQASAVANVNASSWCHGATGLGTAILRMKGWQVDAVQARHLRELVGVCRAIELGPWDHPCCGNLGRADFLLAAGLAIGDESVVHAARAVGEAVLKRGDARGCFGVLLGDVDDSYQPGFFQGLAGIGYALLRLDEPADLPWLLAFE